MAQYGNPTGGSPGGGGEDLYSDSPEPAEESKEGKEGESSAETTIIPKSMLMGKEFKPGEEVVFEVVGIHDDQVEIKYATGKDEGAPPGKEAGAEPEAGGGNPEMASMYS